MLKKCISLAIVCAMLAGLFVPAYAADSSKSYAEYVMTDNAALAQSGFSAYSDVSVYNGFRPGNTIPAKTGDTVYEISTRDSGKFFTVGKSGIVDTYTEGEKVHVSTEMMVASGSTFREPRLGGAGLTLSVITNADNTSATAAVGVNSAKTPNSYAPDKVICFDHHNRITLFGGSVHTNMNWAYDRWYKFDVVIVMGANPKAAIYVDGQPLAVDVNYGNGAQASADDAVFDACKTTTDYIDIGCISTSGFAPSAIYGVSSFAVTGITASNNDARASVYVDNMKYNAMGTTDYPAIDSALGFKGIADGSTLDRAALDCVEINVPAWFAHQTFKVALSVDGAEAIEDSSAPYTFDLSTLERGVRHITLIAYDANDAVIKQTVRTLTVAGNEEQLLYKNDFEVAAPFNESALYAASSPHLPKEMTEDRITTFENVTDSAGNTKLAAKMYSKSTDQMRIGYKNDGFKLSGTVSVSYDMYLDNSNVGSFAFVRNEDFYKILVYDNGKYKTHYDTNYGLKSEVSFDAVTGYWQNWQWTFDLMRKTASLKIDGETKIHNVVVGNDWLSRDCIGFRICFANSGTEVGNFLAVDNFSVTRHTGYSDTEYDMYDYNNKKGWSEYTFSQMGNLGILSDRSNGTIGDNSKIYAGVVMDGEGTAPLNSSFKDSIIAEISADDAYASGNALAVSYSYNRGPYDPRYGSMTVEFDFYLDNINHDSINWQLDGTTFAIVKSGETRIRLDAWGGFNTGYDIIPGQWHRYKFVIEYNNGNRPYVGMYVDGAKVFYSQISTLDYAPHNISKPSYFKWLIYSKDNSGKNAANKMAIDNIRFAFEPVVPYISSVNFGADNCAAGLVKTAATSATVGVSGMLYTSKFADQALKVSDVTSKISLIDVESGTSVSGVNVSAAHDSTDVDVINVTLSNLSLEEGKQYKILLDSGMNFDAGRSQLTNEPSSVVFTTVEELPTVAAPDDGVDGSITVADVRFTTNSPLPLAAGALKGYAGGTIEAGKELRADVMINNASSEAQSLRILIATYEGNELTGISLGGEYSVPAKAESMVFTSGRIDIAATSAPDIKVMILTDTNAIVPVSKAFSLDN